MVTTTPNAVDSAQLVDAESLAYMQSLAALGPQNYDELSAQHARAALRNHGWRPPAGARTLVLSAAHSCEAILYAPPERRPPSETGLLLYLHGGGFVIGDATAADPICRRFATEAGCYVLSVDYRLAPESPFPAAVDDALCALEWAFEHAAAQGWSERRLAIAGQSAGGNLAAVAAQRFHPRTSNGLRLQLLVCPLTDFRPNRHASRREFANNSVLPAKAIAWFERRYLPQARLRDDPRASPLAAPTLRGLPRAHVIVANADPLRDEGEAYAYALQRAGVPVLLERYPSVHGFMGLFCELRQGEIALRSALRSVRAALSGP